MINPPDPPDLPEALEPEEYEESPDTKLYYANLEAEHARAWNNTTTPNDKVGSAEAFARRLEREQYEKFHPEVRREQPKQPNGKPNGHDPNASLGRQGRKFTGFISSAEFMARMRPPDYLADGLILRGSTYTLTGNTGHCKTLTLLLLAVRVARGEWFCGRKCKQGTVVFFAGENPDNVRYQYYAMCAELGVNYRELDIVWHEGVFDIAKVRQKVREDIARLPDLALVIVDSLQAFFMGDDDTHNMQMLNLAVDLRLLAENHQNRPSTLITAHPVKNASRDQLLPRGGSSITNELDGNLTVWLDNNIVSMHWLGKFRGIPFEPIQLEQVLIKPQGLIDAAGNQMPATIVRPVAETRETELQLEARRIELALLTAINDNENISQRELSIKTGVPKTSVKRQIEAFTKAKWMRNYSGKIRLTTEGKKALEILMS